METINLLIIAEGAAAEAGFFTHENLMDFLLITIPTLLLAIVTVWSNEHMYQIAKMALLLITPKKKKPHGRHERVEVVTRKSKHESSDTTEEVPEIR